MGSCQRKNISSPTTESVDKRAKDTKNIGDISSTAATPENRRRKTPSEQNKQFDPGGKGEKASPWNAAVTLLSFSGESWRFLVCALCCLYFVCALFSQIIVFYPGDHFSVKLKDMRGDADQVDDVRNRRE